MSKAEETEIEVETVDGIGWIKFNRPQVSNAVRPQTMQNLCRAIDDAVASDDIRAIVVTGNGKHFAAGADLEWLKQVGRETAERTRDSLYEWFVGAARRLWRCGKPTIAAVNGHAVTVGCELALACDVRIVCENSVFHESWLRLGLLAPLGGAVLLPRLIGFGRASEMILGAKRVDAQEAIAIGLAQEFVPAEQLRTRAAARALELASFDPRSYRLAKESLRRPLDADMEREWQANVLAQSLLLASGAFAERLKGLTQGLKRDEARMSTP